MVNKVAVSCYIWPVCVVMWGLNVDYIISEVGHTGVRWKVYLFRGIGKQSEIYVY